MFKTKLFLLLTLFISFLSIPLPAHAQESQGLDVTINPAILEFTTTPGTSLQQTFRIRNNLSQPLSLTLSVEKLNGSDSSGHVIPVPALPGDNSLSWIKFKKTSFSALSKEWTDVQFTLTIPKDAAFGYYYAIRIAQTPHVRKTNTTTTVVGEVVIPILLEVKKPGAVKQAQILEFKTSNYINEYLPVDFTTVISNTGNVHIKPQGNIFIRGSGEKDLGILDLNENVGSVLPGNKRNFQNSWDDGFFVEEPILDDGVPRVDKEGKPVKHLVINWNKVTSFRIGKYTANVLVVYDNGTRDVTLESATTFWVIPYKIILGIIIILVVLAVCIRFMLKLYIKKQVQKYQNAVTQDKTNVQS